MFNSAYSVGGPVCAVKTVESVTGIRMDHCVEIDFSGFAELVDALGGVDPGLDSLKELTTLGRSLGGLTADRVKTVTMPVVTAPSGPDRVVVKEPAASDLWASLR